MIPHSHCMELGELTMLPDLQNHEERILASGTSFITARRKLYFHFGPIPEVVITPIPLQPFMKVMDLRDMQACPYQLCRLGETAGLINRILY